MTTTNMMDRINTETLGNMVAASGGQVAPRALFLPTGFAEAMELSKLMAAGIAVPKHLRGKPADCLAVLMQAARWGLDPFAVANKSYFVNDRLAYEAQLVVAVLNGSGVLSDRMAFEWQGEGEKMKCVATATLKADRRPKSIEQEIGTISTRNSPLWKQAPRQQLGYFTARLWARLYAPEVLLGVYTDDEVREMGPDNARDITPQPTRTTVAHQSATARAQPGEHVINGQILDAEIVGESEWEGASEEEIARRLDAQTDSWSETETGESAAAPEPAADPQPEPPQIDWNPTLDQIEQEFDRRTSMIDLNSYWSSVRQMLADAPDAVKNRASGLFNARAAELKAAA